MLQVGVDQHTVIECQVCCGDIVESSDDSKSGTNTWCSSYYSCKATFKCRPAPSTAAIHTGWAPIIGMTSCEWHQHLEHYNFCLLHTHWEAHPEWSLQQVMGHDFQFLVPSVHTTPHTHSRFFCSLHGHSNLKSSSLHHLQPPPTFNASLWARYHCTNAFVANVPMRTSMFSATSVRWPSKLVC